VIDTCARPLRPWLLYDALPLRWSLPVAELRDVYAGRTPCDVLVFAPSFFYFNRSRRRKLFVQLAQSGARRFTTVFFLENEYRLLEEKIEYATALRADMLVTQLPLDVARAFYGPRFKGAIISCPPGLNPGVFSAAAPIAQRRVHIGTRSHLYPESLGDEDRNAMLRRFLESDGPIAGLTVDVSFAEVDRFTREEWARFLGSCRATIGTEAGASQLCWKDSSGPIVSGKTVSSRHFEALGTRTAQVMFGGRFCDMLRPGEHYIQLQRDFSNLGEVCDAIRDASLLQRLVDRALEYALSAHTYAHRVSQLLRSV
jgi:hypothetical protein